LCESTRLDQQAITNTYNFTLNDILVKLYREKENSERNLLVVIKKVILKVDESTPGQTLPDHDQIKEVSQKNISMRCSWKQSEKNYSSK